MTYISLFRGINVSGRHVIKMETLRQVMTAAGFGNVRTYIQSGNVIFDCPRTAKQISKELEELVKREFGHEITVMTISETELSKAIDENPFVNDRKPEDGGFKRLHMAFLSDEPATENFEKLKTATVANDELVLKAKVLYIRFESKQSDSKLSNALIESKLKTRSTIRNWNTMLKLEEMASATL